MPQVEDSRFRKLFKHAGAYHWKNFVKTINQWGSERGFTVLELEYVEKVPEIEAKWKGERKRDEYLADYFEINIHLWAVRDLPEPKGYIESRGEYEVTAWVETAYEDVYGNRPLEEGPFKKIDEFFRRHVLKMHLEVEHIDKLYYEALNLTRTLQHTIGMDMALTRHDEEI